MTRNEREKLPICSGLRDNIAMIKELSGGSSDVLVNEFTTGGIACALICCEGMMSSQTAAEMILSPITGIAPQGSAADLFSYIQTELLLSTDRPEARDYDTLFRLLNSGFAVLIAEGADRALAFGVQGYASRGIQEPSGEGNIINPVASLLNDKVYAIPMIFIVGWRGEPGVHDEPQHIYQGEVTVKLLDDMDIRSFVIGKDTSDEEAAAKMTPSELSDFLTFKTEQYTDKMMKRWDKLAKLIIVKHNDQIMLPSKDGELTRGRHTSPAYAPAFIEAIKSHTGDRYVNPQK